MGNIVELLDGISAPEPVENRRQWRSATNEEHAAHMARRAAADAAKEETLASAGMTAIVGDQIEIPAGAFQGWKGTVVSTAPLTVRLTVFGKDQDYVIE